jgi:hypothetical protein
MVAALLAMSPETHSVLFDWPYLGLGVAALVVAWVLIQTGGEKAQPRWRTPLFLLPLVWPMYIAHQFEEHGVDFRGRRYAFLGALCQALGYDQLQQCPADPAFVFAVNVGACWIAFALALVFRRTRPLIAACAWGIPLVNVFAHVGAAIRERSYNPGLVTAIGLFIPLTGWVLVALVRARVLTTSGVLRVVATGVVTHVVLIASVLLRARGGLTEASFLILNVANGLWPLVFGATY